MPLTRRTALATAGVLTASIAAAAAMRSSGNPRGSTVAGLKQTPTFDVPPGACDSHVHVIGDPAKFPMAPDRDYTPPAATTQDLRAMLTSLHLDRVVIVAPTNYGTDNAATLDAVNLLGRDRARGIVLIDAGTSPKTLDTFASQGIVGVRQFLSVGEGFDAAKVTKRLETRFELARQLGWHLDIAAPPDAIAALAGPLAASPVPLVLDVFAWLAGGIKQDGYGTVVSLLKSGRAYVKLAEPYKISKQGPDYPDIVPVVHGLVEANPDRILWGSGWPHVDSGAVKGRAHTDLAPNLPVDAGHVLNLLAAWVPDPDRRHKILVDNPARLYGF